MTSPGPRSPFPHADSVHHDGSPSYVRGPHPPDLTIGDQVTLRLRAATEARIERVLLRTEPDGEQHLLPMQVEEQGEGNGVARWWQLRLEVTMPVTAYRFLLFTSYGAWWYNGSGLHQSMVTDAEDFRLLAGYTAPTWVWDSVFYQIFPDRFADGDSSNNVRQGEFVYWGVEARQRSWGSPPSTWPAAMVEFYGGDLRGIEQRLDYLQELGVNALYLNPIFSALSNHRYDVIDYRQVDPHLGGNGALVSLREATKRRDIRYILDIVPNHTGVMHPWFQAAQANPSAPTAEFYTFFQHPDAYASWLGHRSLPKLNYRSERLRQEMYAGEDSVLRRWLKEPYRADGWRIDVANMLGRQGQTQIGVEVCRGIRRAVKEVAPQAYLLGENFFDASEHLQGDMWDGVMNYSGFLKPLVFWVSQFEVRHHGEPREVLSGGRWPTQALLESWCSFRASIPWAIARQQFNLLGSHDTMRILDVVGGNDTLNRLVVAVLMTYPGVPCVYYGNEVGLRGHIRAPMPWSRDAWNQDLLAYYQKLIRLRRTSHALRGGGFQVLMQEEDSFAYLRDVEEEQIVVLVNRGPSARPAGVIPVAHGAIPDGAEMLDVIGGIRSRVERGFLTVPELPPGAQVWRSTS